MQIPHSPCFASSASAACWLLKLELSRRLRGGSGARARCIEFREHVGWIEKSRAGEERQQRQQQKKK